MAGYARHLFDIFYLYGLALSRLNTTDPTVYRNLSRLLAEFTTPFEGWFQEYNLYSNTMSGTTGHVQLDQNLARIPMYQVYGLNEQFDQKPLINISLIDDGTVC